MAGNARKKFQMLVRIREVVGSNPIRSTRKGREIVDFTTFFQLISDIFGPVFVTYLSSTMIFLHFSQRYAVILSPFNLATRPPSAFRRWRCGPLCHNNAARLHTLPCIISAPQNGQFITIPLPSKFIWISFSIAYCYIICHRRQGRHTHCCSISEMLWHL